MSSQSYPNDAPNPAWYPGSYGQEISQAYTRLQRLLADGGYVLADTMIPPRDKMIEANTAKCLHSIIDEFPVQFVRDLTKLVPPVQPPSTGRIRRFVAANVRLSTHLEGHLQILRKERAKEKAIVDSRLAREAQAEEWRKREEARLEQARRDEAFRQLGGGDHVLEACLAMDASSQAAMDLDPEDSGSETVETDPLLADWITIEAEALSKPSKRVSETRMPESPPKRPRTDTRTDTRAGFCGDIAAMIEAPLQTVRATSTATPAATRTATRAYTRVDSDSTASVVTSDISTTVSSTTTARTTPISSQRLLDCTSRWQPIPALPLAERDALIAPANDLQKHLNKLPLAFHIQWEMTRQIRSHSTVQWTDITVRDLEFFSQPEAPLQVGEWLEGIAARKNGVAHEKTTTLITGRKRRMLIELEREEASIRAKDLRGVLNEDPDWRFGGKIAYVVTVSPSKGPTTEGVKLPNVPAEDPNPFVNRKGPANTLPFTMTLNPPEMPGKSFRLARRFGSRRVLQLRLKDAKSPDDKAKLMRLFLGRRFSIFGRTFRALWAPPDRDSVFVIETPEGDHGLDPPMPTYTEILAMYNHMEAKPSQAVAKWAARPQLLFSDSVPALRVNPHSIGSAPDIVSAHAASYEAATTEQTLTDGCGLMSRAFAARLRPEAAGPPSCAVQIRLGGSKGMLALMSHEQEERYAGKDVVLRDSMVKALPADQFENDPSLLTVDLVGYDGLRIGTSLSSEAIVAMVHGGVPASTMMRMGAESLSDLKEAFSPTPLEGELDAHVLPRLVNSCFRRGGVGIERKKRQLAEGGESARVAGLENDRRTHKDEPEKGAWDDLIDPSEQYAIDPVSKQSGSIAESLLDAVQAGFHPKESHYAGTKLHHLMSTLSDTMIRKFRISVDRSITAYIIPDSLQILKPDEIFVSFSTRLPIDPDTQCYISHLTGPVLAFRSPCKLPTDVRKFNAVYHKELAHLKDCVVMSANSELCHRSPASYLGGGDYDGDTVQIFWDPELVEPFTNAPEELVNMPANFIDNNFEKEVVKVSEFLDALKEAGADEEMIIANQQRYLLGAIEDDMATGRYSDMHGSAIYSLGLDHPETLALAFKFCLVLDARKSGLKIRPEVLRADEYRHGTQVAWRNWKKNITDTRGGKDCKRPAYLGKFILDLLMDANIRARTEMMGSFPRELEVYSPADYRDLSSLWLAVMKRAAEYKEQLAKKELDTGQPEPSQLAINIETLYRHIETLFEMWKMSRSSRLARGHIKEHYPAFFNAVKNKTPIPMTPSRRVLDTPGGGKDAKAGAKDALLRLTQVRQLAELWRDFPLPADVPALAPFGDEDLLRRMKVSCGVCVETRSSRNKKVLFVHEMDSEMTREMKAKATGSTVTMREEVYSSMKPAYRRPGE